MECNRILIGENDPYTNWFQEKNPCKIPVHWPCKWVGIPKTENLPFVSAYRCFFAINESNNIRLHISADERYELFIDGKKVGRGSERGDKNNWFFETYDISIEPGNHVMVARVWSFGCFKPDAQFSIVPSFICSPDKKEHIKILGTGIAKWEVKKLNGYDWNDCGESHVITTGNKLIVDGNEFPWGFEKGEGVDWQPAISVENGYSAGQMYFILNSEHHLLKPAMLPAMYEQEINGIQVKFAEKVLLEKMNSTPILFKNNDKQLSSDIHRLLYGKEIRIEPDTSFRAIIDLNEYYCVYPSITVSCGKDSVIKINWAETLFDDKKEDLKSNRNEIENKYFRGYYDTFIADGGLMRKFDTLWWQAGRYIEISVKTKNEPLTINQLKLVETRYPLECVSVFSCDENRLMELVPISIRTLQMCSHETLLDCPFYEQVMYAGDSRVQNLAMYAWTNGKLLAQKAIHMFEASSINPTGFIEGAYPSNNHQVIPSWCLWWIGMVFDYALWNDDKAFVEKMMPTVRKQLELFWMHKNTDGLIKTPGGWNLIDWANNINNQPYEDEWSHGEPFDGGTGISALINLQFILILTYVSSLENYLCEYELAERTDRLTKELMSKIIDYFWDDEKGMFADDLQKKYFSEHSQVLAVLTGLLDKEKTLNVSNALRNKQNSIKFKTSVFFSHYLFEAYNIMNCIDLLLNRLAPWLALMEDGLKTIPEVLSDITRSDCHAWSTHPIYHYLTTIVGIRPTEMGFKSVQIKPQLGVLNTAEGSVTTPYGIISVKLEKKIDGMYASIQLPDEMQGIFVYNNHEISLTPGFQKIKVKE